MSRPTVSADLIHALRSSNEELQRNRDAVVDQLARQVDAEFTTPQQGNHRDVATTQRPTGEDAD